MCKVGGPIIHNKLLAMCETPSYSRGDQILEVDSVSLRHVALSEAYAILSECGPGPVSLIISRHPNPKVRVSGLSPLPLSHSLVLRSNL